MDGALAANQGGITVLSGPSGSGKGTVIRRALELASEKGVEVWLSVSDTSREPRCGERSGIDYNFISRAQADERVAAGYYLESAMYAGNFYGTPKDGVVRKALSGAAVLIEIELHGARQVMRAREAGLAVRPTTVFLAPPSWEELVRRLSRRGTEDEEKIRKRLASAQEEMRASTEYDMVIINDDVDRAAHELLTVLSR